MIFDKNQTEFVNSIQQEAWEAGTRLMPLDVTLPYVPDELKSICVDLYNFTYDMLVDKYQNHENCESGVIPVGFYFHLLFDDEAWEGNTVKVSPEKFKHLIKTQYTHLKDIPITEMRTTHGFVLEQSDNIILVSNDKYPGALKAARILRKTAEANYKLSFNSYYEHCDFRAFAKYKLTYKDLYSVLSDDTLAIAEQIHNYCADRKVTPQQCRKYWQVEYKHKGKRVYEIYLRAQNKPRFQIVFANPGPGLGSESFQMIEEVISKYDDYDEFKDFCFRHIKKCPHCNRCAYKLECKNLGTSDDFSDEEMREKIPNCKRFKCGSKCDKHKNPLYMELFGNKITVCFIRVEDPKEQDLKHILRLIDLRVMEIQAKS